MNIEEPINLPKKAAEFTVIQVVAESESVLSVAASLGEIADIIVEDALTSETLIELPDEDRRAVFEAVAALGGATQPPFPKRITI